MTHPLDYAYPVAPGDVAYWQPGMTLRDWFAGQALAGLPLNDLYPKTSAETAYLVADAMMEARK